MSHLCAHMKAGLSISTEGMIRLCCKSQEYRFNMDVSIESIDDLNEYFNSEYYISIRKKDFRNMNVCKTCVYYERVNQNSLRLMMKDTYDEYKIDYTRPDNQCIIEHLDVSFSNLCNQQCLMCRSEYSSKWYTFDKDNENTIFQRRPIKYKKWSTEKNINKIKKILPNIKLLVIKGGEPTIQEEVLDILSYIKYNNLTTHIQIVSNLQQISDDILELITSLNNLKITISLDSVGDRYNWIRNGNWNKTINNIKKYVENCKNMPNFGYANTLNKWSVKSLVEDIKIIEEINSSMLDKLPYKNKPVPWYNITIANRPLYVSPLLLPKQDRFDVIQQFENYFGPIINDSVRYKSLTINHLYNVLSLENDDMEIIPELIETSKKWENEINNMQKYNPNQ